MKSANWFYIVTGFSFSIVVSIITAVMPPVNSGLEYLFLLPLSFAIAFIFYNDLFLSWNENYGTIIIFVAAFLRYIVSPLLMSLTNHSVAYINATMDSYFYAIFIMIYELFAVLIILRFVKKRFQNNKNGIVIHSDRKPHNSFNITWIGAFLCTFVVIILISRGNLSNVFSHLSILNTYSEDLSDLYTYDLTFVYLIKSFLFIAIISKMVSLSKKYPSFKEVFFVISFIAVLLNSVIYDHKSRSVMVEFMVSSIVVLISGFPQKRKLLLTFFSVFGFLLVSTVFISGTLLTTWSGILEPGYMFERISEMGELYGNGVSTMAHTIDTYPIANSILGFDSFLSHFVRSIGFITFPGFRYFYYALFNIPTASSIFMQTLFGKGFILPPFGVALYYGDLFLAVPISFINCFLCIWTLYWIENIRIKLHNDIGTIYIITFAEIICGMSIFVNNIFIMIQGLTQIPLYFAILLWFNNLGNRILLFRNKSYKDN